MNAWDQVRAAIDAGKTMQSAVDDNAGAMGRLLVYRLRASGMSNYILKALKEELRDYNIHTGRWRR